MNKIFFSSIIFLAVTIFAGCATGGYTQSDVGDIRSSSRGIVVAARNLTINDSGAGGLIGGVAGGAAGSQLGKGDGKVAATIGGAVLGAMLGGELNSDAGQELTIRLDNGQEITTVYRVNKNAPYMFRSNDRVIVDTLNSKVSSIRPLN